MDRSSCGGTRHGTYVAYQRHGCRCADAREDQRLYQKRRREQRDVRRIPAVGYARMVRALQALGWPLQMQAETAGLPLGTIRGTCSSKFVSKTTARRLTNLYKTLNDVDGPSRHTENRAWAAGHPPPGAWTGRNIHDPAAEPDWIGPDDQTDPVLAAAAAAGTAVFKTLNPQERVLAYRYATQAGVSKRSMCHSWRVSGRVLDRLEHAA